MSSRFKCNLCGKTFRDNHGLNLHTRVHTGERPFKCTVCYKAFQQNGNLKQHMVLHSNNYPCQCESCSKCFATKGYLRKHAVVHSKERPIKCTSCDQRFYSRQRMKEHFDVKHNDELKLRPKPFGCKECNSRFNTKTHLAEHQAKHTGERKYKCSYCDKTFAWDSNLRVHIKQMHKPREKETCQICGTRVFKLKEHMVTHKKDRPVKCDLCGNMFKHPRNLTLHLKVHINEKPEVCSVSGKRFQRGIQLKRHLLVEHLKPVSECLFCLKVVKEYRMEHHLRIHTNEKPWMCQLCGDEFFTNDQRRRHLKNCTMLSPLFLQGDQVQTYNTAI